MIIAVVIVNYQSESFVEDCLHALHRLERHDLATIIVDNSSPGCGEAMRAKFASTTFLPQERNLGYAAGANVGIRHALSRGADYVCLLNPDTVIRGDFLAPLIKSLEENPSLGVVCPRIITGKEKQSVWYAGGEISWLKGGPRHFQHTQPEQKVMRETGFATGCCMLIRRKVLDQCPLLPEFYFLYFEDADYSTSIRKSGWRIGYCANAEIYHQVSATTKYRSPAYVYYFARNRIWFMRRWAPAPGFILFCLTNTFCRLPIALAMFALIDRKTDLMKAILIGFIHGFTIKPENAYLRPITFGPAPEDNE